MNAATSISIAGCSLVFFYLLSQIFNFFDIDASFYGKYFAFYLFLIFSLVVLNTNNPGIVD